MSKYYQQLQKNYKYLINKKMYSKNFSNRVYLQKYMIAFSYLDLKQNLKEIISKANYLELHHNSFKTKSFCWNGDIYIYCTNKKELFFLILEKIIPFYFLCYENFFFENNELNFLFLYELFNNNLNNIYLIIMYTLYMSSLMIIYFYIINVIFIV
jgi:hypothetical protein